MSFILPASAIMYASGATDDNNNDGSSTGGGSTTDNNTAGSSGGSTTDNNTAGSSGGSTASNNIGNAQGENLASSILAVHNKERAAVGVPPLTWSDTLAASAQTWAQHLATSGEFKHSPDTSYGENIAGYTLGGGVSAPGEGQSKWVEEKSKYVPATPASSDTGHYTQMVDKQSTEVGCGTATGDGHPFSILVCQYLPPGNWNGKPPY